MKPTQSKSEVIDGVLVAAALEPLLKQIFHGDNHTSVKIHEELKKSIALIKAIIARARLEERRRIKEWGNDELKPIIEQLSYETDKEVKEYLTGQRNKLNDLLTL